MARRSRPRSPGPRWRTPESGDRSDGAVGRAPTELAPFARDHLQSGGRPASVSRYSAPGSPPSGPRVSGEGGHAAWAARAARPKGPRAGRGRERGSRSSGLAMQGAAAPNVPVRSSVTLERRRGRAVDPPLSSLPSRARSSASSPRLARDHRAACDSTQAGTPRRIRPPQQPRRTTPSKALRNPRRAIPRRRRPTGAVLTNQLGLEHGLPFPRPEALSNLGHVVGREGSVARAVA